MSEVRETLHEFAERVARETASAIELAEKGRDLPAVLALRGLIDKARELARVLEMEDGR